MDKDKAILPISYFGPVEYYWIAMQYDTTLEACENYQKRTVRNRAQILGANGPMTLSVPLQKGKTLANIKAVHISYAEDWPAQHIKTLKSAYNSAPFFDYYSEPIFSLISKEWTYLWELDMAIMQLLQGWLDFQLPQLSEFFSAKPNDYTIDKRSMKTTWLKTFEAYNQVFEARYGYLNNLSILDALFNLGPSTQMLLSK